MNISILTNAIIREGYEFPPEYRVIIFQNSDAEECDPPLQEQPHALYIIADDIDPNLKMGIGTEKFICFTKQHGDRILDFLKSNPSITYWFVSCEGGISRSSSVALFLCDYFHHSDAALFSRYPWIRPNAHISKIMRALL